MSKSNPAYIKHWKNKRTSAKKQVRQTLRKLKSHKGKRLNTLAEKAHTEAFEQIDCLDCGNCCSTIPPIVNSTDSKRIAKFLGMSPAAFEAQYVTIDEDGDTVMNQSPCPFLGEGLHCFIYEVRPKACREYPHTYPGTFSSNFHLHQANAFYCPAVFFILEKLERQVPEW